MKNLIQALDEISLILAASSRAFSDQMNTIRKKISMDENSVCHGCNGRGGSDDAYNFMGYMFCCRTCCEDWYMDSHKDNK